MRTLHPFVLATGLIAVSLIVFLFDDTPNTFAGGIPTPTPVRTSRKPSAPTGSFGSVTVVNTDTNVLHNETSIAIDPNNSSRILATTELWDGPSGYQPYAYYYLSTDGGATWSQGDVMKSNGATFGMSPWVTFDKNGNGYFIERAAINRPNPDGMYLARLSPSNVWTMAYPVTIPVTGFADKPFVAVDRSNGPFANRVYATWAWVDSAGMRAIYSSHTDWTTTPPTFSTQVRVSTPVTNSQWSYIAVGADGAVYVSYVSYETTSQILLAKSTDGGVSFTNTYTIGVAHRTYNGGADLLQGSPTATLAVNNGAALVAHPTLPNKLAAVWTDGYGCSTPNQCLHTHIVASHSNDSGATWSTPVVVNDDGDAGNRDHLLPALTVGSDGMLHSTWYDRRVALNPSNPYLYNFVYSSSSDWGQTWSCNMKVSTGSSDPAIPNFGALIYNFPSYFFIGEYTGLAVTNDGSVVMPFWADASKGVQNVVTSRVTTPVSGLSMGQCSQPRIFLPLIMR